jgi:hypothetical protein
MHKVLFLVKIGKIYLVENRGIGNITPFLVFYYQKVHIKEKNEIAP